jgi:PMP-22/EMP/MP20/Claudin tight junction
MEHQLLIHVLGLWEMCLNNFEDIHRFYDVRFSGCMWIFEEEYYIIHDYLLPPFFITVQFFFTLAFTLLLVSVLLTLLFLTCSKDHERYIHLLITNGSCLVISGVFAVFAVILFGCYGDSRDWMPNWEHNNMGWSFAVACPGSLMLFPAGILFLIEARRLKYKRLNEIGNHAAYTMDDRRRYGGHTDI